MGGPHHARAARPAPPSLLLPLAARSAPIALTLSPLPSPPQIWVTTIVLGHLLGITFLLYSVERVTGVFSRLARKAGLAKGGADADADRDEFAAGSKAIDGAFGGGGAAGDEDIASVRAPRWVRGCACKVRSMDKRGERERDGERGGGAAEGEGTSFAHARAPREGTAGFFLFLPSSPPFISSSLSRAPLLSLPPRP